jgi:hypothetical protein
MNFLSWINIALTEITKQLMIRFAELCDQAAKCLFLIQNVPRLIQAKQRYHDFLQSSKTKAEIVP